MRVEEWLGKENKLGIDIWNNKYRFENETFDEWLNRVSNNNEKLKQLIIDKKYLHGGRTLTNYNTHNGSSVSNCYSSGYAPDDLEGLLELNKNIGLTYKAQGGQGISLSKIRPKGSPLSKGYTTDGIIPFMEIFNTTTSSVSQGGSRKGALILSIDIWHKEAESFITIKSEEGKIEKANLSLEIDDEFMNIVENDIINNSETIIPREFNYINGVVKYEVVPVKLFRLLCERAWDWAEPGIIFTNRFRNYNVMELCDDYQIETCNPCGEQPLPKNGACNLGSINLSEFIINPYTEYAYFDFDDFKKSVSIAVNGLDEVLDYGIQYHALKEQQDMAKNYRNLGLGIMGLGSAMFKLGMTYGSGDSKKFVSKIMKAMFREAVIQSSNLANKKGSFPNYTDKVWESNIIKEHFTTGEIKKLSRQGLRNCSLLSVAPSGSIGTMLNVTTGVEPAFRISYKRKTESLHKDKDVYYDVFIKEAQEYMNKYQTDELPSYFIGSDKVNYYDRVNIQGIMQQSVDTAISSTVNLPNETNVDDVVNLYIYAWKQGLKGITIYRDGCKRGGILTTEDNKIKDKEELKRGDWKSLAEDTIYIKKSLNIGCGKLKLFIGYSPSENVIQDLYIKKAGQGGCTHNLEAVAVALSAVYRLGGSTHNIEKAFSGLGGCNSFLQAKMNGRELSKGTSCATSILNILNEFEKEMNLEPVTPCIIEECKNETNELNDKQKEYLDKYGEISFAKHYNICPICHEELSHDGGCLTCLSCGWTKCE